MHDYTPEQLFLLGRPVPMHGRVVEQADAVMSYAGKGVTHTLWRWRVVRGWPVVPALETDSTATKSTGRASDPGRSKSIYRGVTWDKSRGLWRARITIDSRNRHLGWYRLEDMAGCAYDLAAIRIFGPDAKLNFK